MNLNDIAPEPESKPLRIVRLPTLDTDNGGLVMPEDQPVPFEGGEALPESQGYDVGHPISEAEAEALAREGWSPDEIIGAAFVDKGFTNESDAAQQERMIAEAFDRAQAKIEAEAQAEYEAELAQYHTRDCPLPTCEAMARVPKGGDQGDVLGIGMSMRAAVELEQLLTSHLQEHTLGEWMAALKHYQDQPRWAPPAVPTAGIVQAEGIIPGPARRDPAKQAAVDALDRRLGGKAVAPVPPADVAERDEMLREIRRRRRAAPETTPYDLTPRWSQDIGDGVVGIKR